MNRYNLALKLGNRHNINLSSIAFEHASSLLQSSEIDLKKVSDRLEDKGLLQLLKEQPDITCERCKTFENVIVFVIYHYATF